MLASMSRLLALPILAALSACNAQPASPSLPAPAPIPAQAPSVTTASLIDLSPSLDALKADFNAHRGEARFLTLLSPT
jgi:hypothetical protein